jgi:hypothetical protein
MLTDISFESYHHPAEVLSRHPSSPQIVVDYRALTTEPRTTVHTIYRALGLPLCDRFDQFLKAQEDREKSHQTHFQYSIDDYEVSAERIESELDSFYTTYDWPRAQAMPQAVSTAGEKS